MFNIKREIEKDFDREKNYQGIMNKIGQRKEFNWKYLFGPALAGIAIGVLLLNIGNTMKKENFKLELENVVGSIENTQKVKKEWITKKVSSNPELIVTPAIATVKDWEKATIAEKFCDIKYDEKTYNGGSNIVISEDELDKSLGEFEITALNAETSATVVIKINVYKINNVAEKVAIAIKFEEDDNYYIYRNRDYIAENLSELFNGLNLKEKASFDYINYYEWYGEEKYDYNYIEFIDVEEDIIWNFLNYLEDPSLETDDKQNHKRIMGIHLNLEELGFGKYEFITILEDGYVSSTMSGNECYYIGEDKTEEFIEYIIDNYDGYHYVWDEPNPVADQSSRIMTIENKVGAEPQEKRITNQTTAPTNRTEAYNPNNTTTSYNPVNTILGYGPRIENDKQPNNNNTVTFWAEIENIDDLPKQILVQGTQDNVASYRGKIYLEIKDSIKITKNGEICDLTELKEGQLIKVYFSGLMYATVPQIASNIKEIEIIQ